MTRENIKRIFEVLNEREYVCCSDFENVFRVDFLEAKRWIKYFEAMGYIKKDAYHPKMGTIFVKGPKLAQRSFNTLNSLDVPVIDMSS